MPDISLLRRLFNGRTDVFAIRWQKGTKSGYAPAYQYDPYLWRQHKMGGGTMQNFSAKSYLPLSDAQIEKHLEGQQFIGIYPMLPENTTWWLAADFDENDWIKSTRRFIHKCREFHIPAYLERSRSGNGGHVWVFFDQQYPAAKSRRLFTWLLEDSGAFSVFDKSASFDRLFPNQDYLSGKGLGNLIALPLHGPSVLLGNCCFLDPDTMIPYPDQWAFLATIERVSVVKLEALLEKNLSAPTIRPTINTLSGKLTIVLNNELHISRNGLVPALTNFLKDTFLVANSAFYVKEKTGRSTWKTDRFFKLIEEEETVLRVPRGGAGTVLRFCKSQNIPFDFRDERPKLSPVSYQFSAQLLAHQEAAMKAVQQKEFGIIVAPPGSGKTVVALNVIAEKQQPALVLVHRKQLVDQWVERIEAFLGLARNEIGIIGKGKMKPGKKVTVATIQSLPKAFENPGFATAFGLILVDECHHVPAETFRSAIAQLHTRFLYGLTATPFRKHSDSRLIFLYLGEIISEIKPEETSLHRPAKIVVRQTTLDAPFNPKTDAFEILSKILVHDSNRNKTILQDIENELRAGHKGIVLTERKEHIETLHQYLKQRFETITLSGDDSETSRTAKWQRLHSGNYQLLITTGQYFGEGTDLKNASCLFLVYPFSFKGKLIQYIGRVQRGEINPVIYDYHDRKIDFLHRMFLKRNAYYRKINHQRSLFDEPDPEMESPVNNTIASIQETIKLPLDQFEFQYGLVSCQWATEHLAAPVVLEIENDYIRPEFTVLIPYILKSLQSKMVSVEVTLEIENGQLLAMSATSSQIDRINREIIETVRFQFAEKFLLSQRHVPSDKQGLLDIEQLQKNENNDKAIFASGDSLLAEVLSKKEYKHSRHIRFLADKHLGNMLKLRFVLSPFAFVFLLEGEAYYHVVLETLDTEEATYIWHFNRDKSQLKTFLERINEDIQYIRTHGRQPFLASAPAQFSRIQHDYSDERKGFIVWRDGLEGMLS